jgi:tetratricopeptide (TPR) repeat protein
LYTNTGIQKNLNSYAKAHALLDERIGTSVSEAPSARGDLSALARVHADAGSLGGGGSPTLRLRMVAAQAALMGGEHIRAAELLEGKAAAPAQGLCECPGVALTLSWLREKGGDPKGALAALETAIARWAGTPTGVELERRAGDMLLARGDAAAAAERYNAVLAKDQRNRDALARLVLAQAATDLKGAEKAVKSLMDPPKPAMDADTLERTPALLKSGDTGAAAAGGAGGAAAAGGGAVGLASTGASTGA